MQLQNIATDVESHQRIYGKWQQRTFDLTVKQEAHEKSLSDGSSEIVEKEASLKTVLNDFSRVTQPVSTTPAAAKGPPTSKEQAKKPTGVVPEPENATAKHKQQAAMVAGLTELFNGTLLKDDELVEGRPNSKQQRAGATPPSGGGVGVALGADGNPRLREGELKKVAGDVFVKVTALREQRVAAENALTDAKLRQEKLVKVKGTLERLQVVIQYAERAVLCEIQRCGATGRKLENPLLNTPPAAPEKKK